MKRFKNILLLLDQEAGSRSILQRAATLAKNNRARLTFVDIIEELPSNIRMLVVAASPMKLQELVVQERQKQLKQLIATIRKKGVRVGINVLVGTPFQEVIREVLRQKHDLVIMAAEGRDGLKGRLFGSTSLHLMRKCPCPVWVMKPTRRRRLHRILAAVDSSFGGEEKNLLNIKIMDLATSLAKMEQSELHIVHAWEFQGESMLRVRGGMSAEQVIQLGRESRASHKQQFDKLVGNYALQDLNHRLHLLKGDASVVITDLAAKKRVDLIVMGTVCRTGMAGFFIGNTAENVLQRVDCSMLTVKPEGFVSPVVLEET